MAKKNRRPAAVMSTPPVRVEFNPDYSVVKKDLRRIAGLAAFFIVALVVLSFFIK